MYSEYFGLNPLLKVTHSADFGLPWYIVYELLYLMSYSTYMNGRLKIVINFKKFVQNIERTFKPRMERKRFGRF